MTEQEERWLKEVYRPHERQLTVRAVLSGMIIGAVMCLSNLYVFLKTGWSMGVTITACILAYAFFRVMKLARLARSELGQLENNAMGSVASAAGYMTGGGNMSAIPALLILTGYRPDPVPMFAWFALIAAMGVFVAIPIKRQLINVEQLAFPTGIATAETLKSLHSEGSSADKGDKAKLLGGAAIVGVLVAWLRDAKIPFALPHAFSLPLTIAGHALEKWTLSLEGSLILFGGGGLISFRTGWSMLLGGLVTYGVIAPWLFTNGMIATVSYRAIVTWTLWPGAAILVASGLLAFAFEWRNIARSFSAIFALVRGQKTEGDALDAIEAPQWWFVAGVTLLAPFVIAMMHFLFGVPLWAGVIAIPLGVLMGIVAARVTGETDVTPTKALGPLTQVMYGAMLPGNMTANVMSGNVTGGVGLHAADLLTDLKSGYLLGAKPRQQLFAQLFGVLAGAAAVVPAFNLLVPDASVLGTDQFPAPSIQVWAGVSKVMVGGLSGLSQSARIAAVIGVILGIVLALAERYATPKIKRFVPSPSGVGLAMVMPGYNAISFFAGALVAELVRRRKPAFAERTVIPVSSGFIAGESLMGILVAMLVAFGVLSK
ncbi:MAG: OPT/YSL family transporter [Deltaproteobacteria bacterium]|nr:OPT/YSL family transporter [Deltaproteobacteria bacterium]